MTSPRFAFHRRRGVIELDILAGLVIVGALTLALAAVLGRQHRAVQKLADSRAAMQLAEAALTDLQVGRPAAPANAQPDAVIEVTPLEAPPDGGGEASDAWVEVRASVRGGRASLVGVVPRGAAPRNAAPRDDAPRNEAPRDPAPPAAGASPGGTP